MESILQSIASNLSLWKRTKWFVVIQTWSWRGKPAVIARARLQEANAERWNHMFPYKFGICVWYQYVEESWIYACMISELAKRMRLHNADFLFESVFGRRIHRKSALCSRILCESTEVMHKPRSDSPLHFDIMNIYQLRKKYIMPALGVCFP